jgi:hypothetical protein
MRLAADKRRLRAAVKLPDQNAELLCLCGAALPCFVQSGLKAICGTLRWAAHLAAINSTPLSEPPWTRTLPHTPAAYVVQPDMWRRLGRWLQGAQAHGLCRISHTILV